MRELNKLARSAEWSTFSEESAICHLFLNSVKCDEARKKRANKLKRRNAKKAQEAGDLPEDVKDYSKDSSDNESPSAPRVR